MNIDLSKEIHPRLLDFMVALVPGFFFETCVFLANPTLVTSLGRPPLDRPLAILIAALIAFVVGNLLMVWVMGPSIWEYLWLRAHVSSEDDVEPAIVDQGKPVSTRRIAAELSRSREAVLENLGRLEAGRYILRSAATGRAYSYRVFTRLGDPRSAGHC